MISLAQADLKYDPLLNGYPLNTSPEYTCAGV